MKEPSPKVARRRRAITLIPFIAIMLALLPISIAFAADDAFVHVDPLGRSEVGITIVFPDGISGSFAGTINGNHFDCETIPPDTLYCIGPFAYWMDPSTLHIYTVPDGEVVLSKVISYPPVGGPDTGPPPPPSDCDGECQTQID